MARSNIGVLIVGALVAIFAGDALPQTESVEFTFTILDDDSPAGSGCACMGSSCVGTGHTWSAMGSTFSVMWTPSRPCGVHWDGSPWVVGPITITSITPNQSHRCCRIGPGSATSNGNIGDGTGVGADGEGALRQINGIEFNPGSIANGPSGMIVKIKENGCWNEGHDARPWSTKSNCNDGGLYSAALDKKSQLPNLAVPVNTSVAWADVVADINELGNQPCNRSTKPCAKAFAVLTVLAAPPPNQRNCLRPPTSVLGTKPYKCEADIDFTALPEVPLVTTANGALDTTTAANWYTGPWLNFYVSTIPIGNEGAHGFSPVGNVVKTGNAGFRNMMNAAAALFRDESIAPGTPRRRAVLAFAQTGWEFYHAARPKGQSATGGAKFFSGIDTCWEAGAQQITPAYLPMLLAAAIIWDTPMVNYVKTVANGAAAECFHETWQVRRRQTGRVLMGDGGPVGGPGVGDTGNHIYQGTANNDENNPAWAWTDYVKAKFGIAWSPPNGRIADYYGHIDGPAGRGAMSGYMPSVPPNIGSIGVLMQMWKVHGSGNRMEVAYNHDAIQQWAARFTENAPSQWCYPSRTPACFNFRVETKEGGTNDPCAPVPANLTLAQCTQNNTNFWAATCAGYGSTWGHRASNNTCVAGSGRTGGSSGPYLIENRRNSVMDMIPTIYENLWSDFITHDATPY